MNTCFLLLPALPSRPVLSRIRRWFLRHAWFSCWMDSYASICTSGLNQWNSRTGKHSRLWAHARNPQPSTKQMVRNVCSIFLIYRRENFIYFSYLYLYNTLNIIDYISLQLRYMLFRNSCRFGVVLCLLNASLVVGSYMNMLTIF
jgi:hypothetical protein